MLGLTSYQEALRAIGRLVGPTLELRLVENAEAGWLELTTSRESRQIRASDLDELIVTSVAQRGEHRPAGDMADVLRSIGLALDELHAQDVYLVVSPDRLRVQFSDRHGRAHELSYAGDELEALRQSAAARRNGQPLRRVLILQAGQDSASGLIGLLVAEFAVQALPTPYARAIAATAEPPDVVLAQVAPGTLDALRVLRGGKNTADVPILALASSECSVDARQLFEAGADDLLQEPVQPAQLRARLRTWLLRARPR